MAEGNGTTRSFQEVGVDNFLCQTINDRIGGWNLSRTAQQSYRQNVLEMSNWRLNLTALSQKYNLYFSAHRDTIHITAPRNLRQAIPGSPDKILALPRSPKGLNNGGYIDTTNPHTINHMLVGNIGHLEILLVACDDGDVLAYYTHLFDLQIHTGERIKRKTCICLQQSCGNIQPLLHDNVGCSAWGLAIHTNARLLAVSSNLKEVTVYFLGRTTSKEEDVDVERRLLSRAISFPGLTPSGSAINAPIPTQSRSMRSYKRILRLPHIGHNIPSIDFADDEGGKVRYVVATDIYGILWVLNIWKSNVPEQYPGVREHFLGCHQGLPEVSHQMGWGVKVLNLQEFKYCSSSYEALGMHEFDDHYRTVVPSDLWPSCSTCYFDNTKSIFEVKDSSAWHHSLGPEIPRIPEISEQPYGRHKAVARRIWTQIQSRATRTERQYGLATLSEFDLFLYILPSISRHESLYDSLEDTYNFTDIFLANYSYYDPIIEACVTRCRQLEVIPDLPFNAAVLRTYHSDIELIPPRKYCPLALRTICEGPLYQVMPSNARNGFQPPVGFQAMERLSLLLKVPELGIVVVGSQVGRVAIIGLTKFYSAAQGPHQMPILTFRLERILPPKSDEDMFRPDWATLMGVAVAPMQGYEDPGPYMGNTSRWSGRPRNEEAKSWRLIMHYSNETILSWELSRGVSGELLVV